MSPIQNTSQRVADDPDLLDLMMAHIDKADELDKPTNYWKVYERVFLPELKKKGWRDFRRRRHSILESFGATDTLVRV